MNQDIELFIQTFYEKNLKIDSHTDGFEPLMTHTQFLSVQGLLNTDEWYSWNSMSERIFFLAEGTAEGSMYDEEGHRVWSRAFIPGDILFLDTEDPIRTFWLDFSSRGVIICAEYKALQSVVNSSVLEQLRKAYEESF